VTATLPQTPAIDFESLSLRDAMDLAVLIEEEARDRYDELAAQLVLHHTPAAADFFSRMVRIEEMHRRALVEKRAETFGSQPIRVTREMIFDVEAPDYDQVRENMTQRRALMTALESEQKAYEFFKQALRYIIRNDVKVLFEGLCAEELHHQKLVKEELARLPPDPRFSDAFSDDPVAVD
jgi:erythrin-vacuolar iron transport family protein